VSFQCQDLSERDAVPARPHAFRRRILPKQPPSPTKLPPGVFALLKHGPEQQRVVGPTIVRLLALGWKLEQMLFGHREWRVPKSPSQATLRERGQSFEGYPVDIALFDTAKTAGKSKHLVFIVECKLPQDESGIEQLERYLASEPHARLGVLANDPEDGAKATYLYRRPSGEILEKPRLIENLPRPHEKIEPDFQHLVYRDLQAPAVDVLKRTVERLLAKVVSNDAQVTRREDQLDQLCSVILLKLESDKQAKARPSAPPFFRPLATAHATAEAIRDRFDKFVSVYPEVFATDKDKHLRLDDNSLTACTEALGPVRLVDLGISTVSTAFQVLRSQALIQGEGQYFTPQAVIRAGIKLLDVQWDDLVIDPACGTGGFLVETMLHFQRQNPALTQAELSRWAQTHIFGIDKDPIGVKLTKAVMQVAGDGSAHCVRGDSIRIHKWSSEYPHLTGSIFADGRFSIAVTNPPFGKDLKVSADDSRLAGLSIAENTDGQFDDLEIGLLYLERAYQLIRRGGKIGIVLPETYFFSSGYSFVLDWTRTRLRPLVVANVPMEAFQGFCRAKTNFYVFEKI